MSAPTAFTAAEIRRRFLEYFRQQGHRVVPSSSVIPHGDRTLLFTNAGMNQFKDIFLGQERRDYTRAVTVQKCIRAGGKHNDLDNVGYTARHLTFFEMLGNFSFGDYFKKEAIAHAWELLTRGFGLDPRRLWVTVFREDEEARSIWRKDIGLPAERIIGLGEKDNFWSMGEVGPCGPCSEVLVDRGERYSCGPRCGIGSCECDRFFEVWNLVFMQYDALPGGKRVALPRPSIDTGMGLERLAMVLQGVESVFEIDLLRGLIRRVEELTGAAYHPGPEGVPHRVVADHIRSLAFAFADGAEPSNEGRGYVLRRILRRAARYGRKLVPAVSPALPAGNTEEPLLARLVGEVVRAMGEAYPELKERERHITALVKGEEERFNRTLDEGLRRFEETAADLKKRGERTIPGREVFFLYDTCGFPVDLVERMAEEVGFSVDLAGYQEEMQRQKERSRGTGPFKGGHSKALKDRAEGGLDLQGYPATRFLGYQEARAEAELLAAARQGDRWEILLSQTPFYAESGGQVGDTGLVRGPDLLLRVEDTQKVDGRFIHLARLEEGAEGQVRPGAVVSAEIDVARRQAIERNHTATHLLHAGLRQVLGTHLHQKGSLVESSRLRFDVGHFQAITREELERVEELVAEEVARDFPVESMEMEHGEALKMGAMALFGEKYGDRVRVVRIGDFSLELCGGTHVRRTGEIGGFGVSGEGSVSAGVRRLWALTGQGALRRQQENARLVAGLAARLRCRPEEVLERVEKLLEAASAAGRASRKEPAGAALSGITSGITERREALGGGEVLLLAGVVEGASGDDLLAAYDQAKRKGPRVAAVLIGRQEGRLHVVVALSPALAAAGADARAVFQAGSAVIGGRGGGRPEMVRGSGSRAEGAEEALEAMVESLRAALKKS